MSPRRWQSRVQDILDAIAEVQAFLTGMSFDEFQRDAKTQKAIAMDLSIIGEAARHVPDAIASALPAVPWPLMRGMRNRVVHDYFGIDPRIVWDTCQQDLQPLIEPLRKILQDNP